MTGTCDDLTIEEVEENGNVAAGILFREETLVTEERIAVHGSIEMTDDGEVIIREYVERELVFYRRVVEVLYIAALNEPEVPEEPKFNEKCIDCCCQAFSCARGIQKYGLRRMRRIKPEEEPEVPKTDHLKMITHMSGIMRRGRAKGSIIFTNMIFPLVKPTFRNIWVATELLMTIVAMILSITSFSLGNNHIFSIIHLLLTILSSILAIIDGAFLLWGGNLFKGVCGHQSEGDSNGASLDTPAEGERDGEATSCKAKCKQCVEKSLDTFDVARLILTELIFYPLLICNIFELITGRSYLFYNAQDGVGFFLFVISLALQGFFVYIVRSYILILANHHSQKKHSPPDKIDIKEAIERVDYDPTIQRSALYFQNYFVFHAIAQMVAQILMIIAIGGVIREENTHLFTENNPDRSIHVSGYLWYMLVSGYILPFFGLLTFFIVTYFWVQEFQIGVCVNVLSLLKLPGIDKLLNINKTKKEGSDKIRKITTNVHTSELKQQFKNLRGAAWFDKFSYPFQSPQMVIISMVYSYLQLGFLVCASSSLSANGFWVFFYVPVACLIGFIANLYVFTVVVFWTSIIVGITVILLIIIGTVIIIVCIVLIAILLYILFIIIVVFLAILNWFNDCDNNRHR